MGKNEMTDAMKAEFIQAFQAEFGFGVLTASANDDAAAMMGAAAWAWQASRAAMVVEMPRIKLDVHVDAQKYMRAQCQEAIEAAGLKVKP